jgi:hypothetical protein
MPRLYSAETIVRFLLLRFRLGGKVSNDRTIRMNSLPVVRNLSCQQIVAVIFVYFTSLVFYRLFLHPLARFPGPKLAAITRYYEGYYDVICGGQYTWKIAEMHKKYGEVLHSPVAV